jgi:PKHD-type hydroxylase
LKSYDYYLNHQISETWAGAPNVFDPAECEKILKLGNNNNFKEGLINSGSSDPIRKSQIFFIESSDPENSWIFERCAEMIHHINYDFFQFDLQKIEVLQVGKYESKDSGYYGKHIDAFRQSGIFRKLSFSVQLSRSEDYEGGDLLLHLGKDPDVAPRDRGSITVFPSYTLHEVTPVTKGTRYSLVGWVTSATKFK